MGEWKALPLLDDDLFKYDRHPFLPQKPQMFSSKSMSFNAICLPTCVLISLRSTFLLHTLHGTTVASDTVTLALLDEDDEDES